MYIFIRQTILQTTFIILYIMLTSDKTYYTLKTQYTL